MVRVQIFLLCTFSSMASFGSSQNATVYEYKFRTAYYIKELTNITTLPDAPFHICRLPDEERIKICKGALKEEFAEDNEIKFREKQPLGKEKMYEVKLSGIYYVNKNTPPITISACMCPTAPPIFLRGNSTGTDVRVYVDLHYGEDEDGFTTPWE